MAFDAMSTAIQKRRGKDIAGMLEAKHPDATENVGLFSGKQPGEHNRTLAPDAPRVDASNGPHAGIDHRVGVDGEKSAHGEMPGGQGHNDGPTQYDFHSKTHSDEHTPVNHENHPLGHTQDFKSKLHEDEHMPVAHESHAPGMSLNHPDHALDSQIRDHVSGHASHDEYNQLKNVHPSSLGAKAKMGAMKMKYGK